MRFAAFAKAQQTRASFAVGVTGAAAASLVHAVAVELGRAIPPANIKSSPLTSGFGVRSYSVTNGT
jgi:hypothetical protein